MSHRERAASIIIFGSKTNPVPERESFGAGETKIAPLARIDYAEYFSVSVDMIGVVGPNYDVSYREVISHDGVDGATGSPAKNPRFGPVVVVVAAETRPSINETITLEVSGVIEVTIKNNAGAIIAALPTAADPDGVGVHVRVHHWS